ncbi:hypothetical protein MSAR_41000 [Mycolicibacterium sarraceniae]|uniref:Integrase catalytic domain-containing protein n=2 Tax=Mycolicibacterium sarraceniae TaxID=1534348 RepID=A0A7I7SVB9_9MYCO|nr:hypothetical protein MSAR_41000 [Mycolicibacterium sarraceniae]
MSTMWRRWQGFNQAGLLGCIDQRGMPGRVRLSKVDQRVLITLEMVKRHYLSKSTPTKKQIIEIARTRLADDGVPVPCKSSMYALLSELDRGEHTTGDATSRRSHANSPDRAFGKIVGLYPGEEVQLDSTPLDAMAVLADGQPCRVDLAAGIDVATGTITAAILRPNACKTVDALELWANSSVPQHVLPGWTENMALARSYLSDAMSPTAEFEKALENKPVIDVRGLVVDRGKIFVSAAFDRATELRGVNCRVAPPYSPTAKPHIERLFKTIGDDFVRWIPGYKGRSVSHRGRAPEKDAVWPLFVLQALLDEWVITVYQNRPHAGLQLTTAPRMKLSPNAIYRAMSASAPTPVRTLTRDEWISMHPHEFRRINRYGINLFNLVYDNDSPRFHQMRQAKSMNSKQKGKWEVRYDPNNLMQIWVRDETLSFADEGERTVQDNGWIECRWVLAKYAAIPFGMDVLKAVRRELGENPSDKHVLERTEQIHRQLLGGPSEPKLRPLTRAEASAGRANLARQELCSAPPAEVEPGPTATAPPTELAAPVPAGRVEPMRPMRLSEGW